MKPKISFFVVFSGLIFFSVSETVFSAAWWGGGSRKDDWVLERGGAMIFYQVKGESNNPEYGARLYLGNTLIETEKNARGVFDDAINNTYKVVILKKNETIASTDVEVRPGENIKLTFDLETGEVEKESQALSVSKIRLSSASSQYISLDDIEKLRDEQVAVLENDLILLRSSLEQKFNAAERSGAVSRFLWGPNREALEVAEEEFHKRKDKLQELKDLEEGVLTEEKRAIIEAKVLLYGREIEEERVRLEEGEKSESFWYRLRTLFQRGD